MTISDKLFKKGDMVCYTSEWLDNIQLKNRIAASLRVGTVLSDHRRKLKYVRVKWDDTNSMVGTTYSPRFIKKFPS